MVLQCALQYSIPEAMAQTPDPTGVSGINGVDRPNKANPTRNQTDLIGR